VADVIKAEEEITWKMYVPQTYDPQKPPGLMVYISPTPKGWMPRKWQSVMDEKNLIWISANESGNRIVNVRRILFAVLGPQVAGRNYAIDSDRIYLSGFSGGGKVASTVAIDFANLFKGAIYICGVLHWKRNPPALYDQVKANRYVFLTGQDDFNKDLTKTIYRKYQIAGLRNIHLMDIPGMSHDLPGTKDFRRALNYLDDRKQ
jgi:predicted peptidase